jgi:hypothetical protein
MTISRSCVKRNRVSCLRPFLGHVFHGRAPAWMIVCHPGRHGVIVYTNDGANCRSRTGLSDNVYLVVVGEVDRVWRGRQVGIGYPNWGPILELGTQLGVLGTQSWVGSS